MDNVYPPSPIKTELEHHLYSTGPLNVLRLYYSYCWIVQTDRSSSKVVDVLTPSNAIPLCVYFQAGKERHSRMLGKRWMTLGSSHFSCSLLHWKHSWCQTDSRPPKQFLLSNQPLGRDLTDYSCRVSRDDGLCRFHCSEGHLCYYFTFFFHMS